MHSSRLHCITRLSICLLFCPVRSLEDAFVVLALDLHLLLLAGDQAADLARGYRQELRSLVVIHASIGAATLEDVKTQAKLSNLLKDELSVLLLVGDFELAGVEREASRED